MAEAQHIAPESDPATGSAESAPQNLYDRNKERVYGFLRLFLNEEDARAQMHLFATSLLSLDFNDSYVTYSDLLVFRLATESLPDKKGIWLPLRDRMLFSCEQIAAITGLSIGSVRTKVQVLREQQITTEAPAEKSQRLAGHYCIVSRELIEDAPLIVNPQTGGVNVPASTRALTQGCSECERALALRVLSIQKHHGLAWALLPANLQTMPASPLFMRKGSRTFLNWAGAPWYLKVVVEGLFATTIVMGIVLSLPRLKSVYELWLEKRMDLGTLTELAASLSRQEEQSPPPTALAEAAPDINVVNEAVGPPLPATGTATTKPRTTVTSEFSEREGSAAASHKVYRILIKTDAPDGIREEVRKMLAQMQALAEPQGTDFGIELPGGIMFDAYVPIKHYKTLLGELGKFGDTRVIITQSRSHVIPGRARVKIWLQRI